jgi:hypothetical protein
MQRAGLFSVPMRAFRLTLLPLALCLSASALAATVYKWVDKNGVVHYSDQPNPSAQAMEVEGAQAYGTEAQPATASSTPAAAGDPGPAYAECVLYQPENDETFPNTSVVSGSIRINPPLRAGHRIAVALDNRRQTANAVVTSTGFTISEVERGTHTLFFAIEDAQGKALCRSEAVTIHVRQPSLLSPTRRIGR